MGDAKDLNGLPFVRALAAAAYALIVAPCAGDDLFDTSSAQDTRIPDTLKAKGFRFNKRLAVGGSSDWIIVCTRGKEITLAGWTTSRPAHALAVPVSPGKFRTSKSDGASEMRSTGGNTLLVSLTESPVYITPIGPNPLLQIAAAWERAPLEVVKDGPRLAVLPLTLTNPLSKPIVVRSGATRLRLKPGEVGVIPQLVDLRRSPQPIPVRHEWIIEGMGKLSQRSQVVPRNPLVMKLLNARVDGDPETTDTLSVAVQNPSREPFRGFVELTHVPGVPPAKLRVALDFKQGQSEIVVGFNGVPASNSYRAGARIRDSEGQLMTALQPQRFRSLPVPNPTR